MHVHTDKYDACMFIQTNTMINLNLMHYKGMFRPDQLLVRPGTPACNHTLQLPVQHILHTKKTVNKLNHKHGLAFLYMKCMIVRKLSPKIFTYMYLYQ